MKTANKKNEKKNEQTHKLQMNIGAMEGKRGEGVREGRLKSGFKRRMPGK